MLTTPSSHSPARLNILKVATSYPRSPTDWQGLFIKKISQALAANTEQLKLSLWAPTGPLPENTIYTPNPNDAAWLNNLSKQGGIAHLLRESPLSGGLSGLKLLHKLRLLYTSTPCTDIYHINWLQNALPLLGLKRKAVITVLGTDFKLLKIPGMKSALRAVLKTNNCILAPNSAWMAPFLEQAFGDLAAIRPINFGIDPAWFQVANQPEKPDIWIAVNRITTDKIGCLFEWGKDLFGNHRQLHLIGPKQEDIDIPNWVSFHGPADAHKLLEHWYPKATGFITLSQHSEGKPQVLLETLAAGVPIIASDNPAHRESIQHGKHGYIISKKDEFKVALETIEMRKKRDELSKHCREHAKLEYGTWNDCAARYTSLYGELMKC